MSPGEYTPPPPTVERSDEDRAEDIARAKERIAAMKAQLAAQARPSPETRA